LDIWLPDAQQIVRLKSTMPSRPILELKSVSIRAGNQLLFPKTCWSIDRDQNWMVSGKNGSGKTLLARAIAGEVPVVAGEIRYNLRSRAGKLPEDCISLVSFEQQRAAAGDGLAAERWFSGEPSLSIGRFLSQELVEEINPFEVRPHRHQTPAAFRRHRQKILDLLQIRALLRRRVRTLSNGEMRKVLIARALLKKPGLLILDDAFAGLDVEYRRHLKHVLEDLMNIGRIRILLMDSMLQDLPRSITHILLLKNCRVVAQGPVRRMRSHPRFGQSVNTGRPLISSDFLPKTSATRKPEKLVQLEEVSIQYNRNTLLSNVNWIIHRGESWALTGPNGSGKSTLLSVINGDNPQAYANRVSLFGRRRGTGESLWSIRKRIGFISSELHLHFSEDLSCLDTVISGFFESYGLYGRPSAEKRRAAQQMLKLFGLAGSAHHPFQSLSTGVQRMVLLARALVKSPDVLLLDEPCQGLDDENREKFLGTIGALLRRRKTTVVYVTHRTEEIPAEIERMLVLKGGCAVEAQILPRRGRRV
jgi:molybdate transport system ATP-binding protein